MTAIKLRQVQEDPNRKDIFGILNEFIQPESATSASQAATSFAQGVKTPNEEFFWGFWDSIFSTAEQIPHGNPAQDKLAVFVRELTLVPETGDKVWEARVWSDLPLLGASVRERLDKVNGTDARVPFHAFIARLLHAGVSPGSETTAIWMLRDALEQDTKPAGDGSDFDRALMTAAVYVEYAGATLAQKLELQPEPQLDEAQRRLLKGGGLWKDKSGLTPDRWAFWGKRFEEQGNKATSPEAKGLALHAARLIAVWARTRVST
ncbi:hypothetical protein F5B22DRAFT_645087 [Xylaria bambusicola]|uniref:uncharacterized protein n=1 Tax=Xylaria bambusicola TaxID=326684 RepID=UPI002008C004|nr:uncharacterized protein F5B22DRAFT_645087 [Xylaria bambusicola]KAI0518323.1 hypothetical protein F5B22DRAFT_645087 [Xylaria bambusicola]